MDEKQSQSPKQLAKGFDAADPAPHAHSMLGFGTNLTIFDRENEGINCRRTRLLEQVTTLRSCEYILFGRGWTRAFTTRAYMSPCFFSRPLTVTDVLQSSHGCMCLAIRTKNALWRNEQENGVMRQISQRERSTGKREERNEPRNEPRSAGQQER